tara:strand:+ start:2115 stop:2672 length:558 start_codon:yes stop_codon:yes gene_type:complete
MRILFYLLIFLFFQNISQAGIKKEIINKFKNINNLTFKFKQNTNDKEEEGTCTIKYSKKIYCAYKSKFNKILVSNGKSLIIKSDKNKQYYVYPLKKTPLEKILNRDFILKKLKLSNGRLVDNKYYNFSIKDNNKIINIFFDKKTFNLIGWQTEDIYQNLSTTYIYDSKINQNIDESLFNLPKNHN